MDERTYKPGEVLKVGTNVLKLIELHQRQQQTMLELVLALAQRMDLSDKLLVREVKVGRFVYLRCEGICLLYRGYELNNLRSWVNGACVGKKPIPFGVTFKTTDADGNDEYKGIARKVIVSSKTEPGAMRRCAEVADAFHV